MSIVFLDASFDPLRACFSLQGKILTNPPASPTMEPGLGDGTHHKKRQAHTARGRIPIEKNVIVVDKTGKAYESTWLKRANGLVKNGRARWLDERTICLACPPIQTEDTIMEEKKEPAIPESGLTLEKLLERMDALRSEMQDLAQTIHIVDGLPESPDAMARSKAIGDMFVEREKTLRQQLSFLERIYTDRFSTSSETEKTERTRMILDKMNDIIPCFDYSEEDNEGNLKALQVITALYNDLLKQA